jgi:hypothetical protein
VAEAALFFCHRPDTYHFYIGDLTDAVNNLLAGRHEERQMTAKKAGLQLRDLGIHGERVVKSFRVSLIDSVRNKIHQIARSYRVPAMMDGKVRCPHCKGEAA